VEIPPKIRERLIVDYDQILPCPICDKIPEPYYTEYTPEKHWYCHCRDEDDHEDYNDPLFDNVNHGAYGELSQQQAIRIWNKSVYEWIHEYSHEVHH